MWRGEKPDRPLVTNPEPNDLQANQPSKPLEATLEGTTQISKDAVCRTRAMAESGAARLGASLHVKGEISGSEDLYVYGMVEGFVQLDEGKLTVGTTAKVCLTEPATAPFAILCGDNHARLIPGRNALGSIPRPACFFLLCPELLQR